MEIIGGFNAVGFNVSDIASRIKSISSNLSTSLSNTSNRFNALTTQNRIHSSIEDPVGAVAIRNVSNKSSDISSKILQVNDVESKASVGAQGISAIIDTTDKMKELATAASNEKLSAEEREGLNSQYQELRKTVDDIAQNTTYNGQNLFDGTGQMVMASDLVSGNPSTTVRSHSLAKISSDSLGLSTDILSVDSATKAKDALYNADRTIGNNRSIFAVAEADADKKLQELSTTQANIAAVQNDSRLLDVDSADRSAGLASSNILQQRGDAAMAHARVSSSIVMQLLK